jgi:hypothetical protein
MLSQIEALLRTAPDWRRVDASSPVLHAWLKHADTAVREVDQSEARAVRAHLQFFRCDIVTHGEEICECLRRVKRKRRA